MKVVFDTNIIVSSFFWRGAPYDAYQLVRSGQAILLTSEELTAELYKVLSRAKFERIIQAFAPSVDALILNYQAASMRVEAAKIPPTVIADPKDDIILACALGGQADFIVSGDHHLLDLGSYQNIPIMDVHEFLARFSAE